MVAAAHVPKAEIHCHIEGAAPPTLALRQAEKYGVDISAIVDGDFYVWSDFTSFLKAYDMIANLFRTADDYAALAEGYLTALADQNCVYSEFFISTDHARMVGISEADYIDGLATGMEAARTKTGIISRMIATGLRHGGPDSVERAATYVADHPHPLITGFGMAGDERMHHPADFVRGFEIARDTGLSITVHAGELVGAHSVREALDQLKPARIGHGVRAIEGPDLVKRLADEEIVLEICPASNIALNVFDDYANHPFNALREAGVKVTLNSDDPPHFGSSIGREYDIAQTQFGLSDSDLLAVTRQAVEAAFVDEETRAQLLAKL
ncbi:MAG: adenosine deaminase [Pseudomonadota bacterium]